MNRTDVASTEHRDMPSAVRDCLSWLAHLLDESLPLRVAEDANEFAQRCLGVGAAGVLTLREVLTPFTAGPRRCPAGLSRGFRATPRLGVPPLSR